MIKGWKPCKRLGSFYTYPSFIKYLDLLSTDMNLENYIKVTGTSFLQEDYVQSARNTTDQEVANVSHILITWKRKDIFVFEVALSINVNDKEMLIE